MPILDLKIPLMTAPATCTKMISIFFVPPHAQSFWTNKKLHAHFSQHHFVFLFITFQSIHCISGLTHTVISNMIFYFPFSLRLVKADLCSLWCFISELARPILGLCWTHLGAFIDSLFALWHQWEHFPTFTHRSLSPFDNNGKEFMLLLKQSTTPPVSDTTFELLLFLSHSLLSKVSMLLSIVT